MIEISNVDYFSDVVVEATKRGLLHKLLRQLNYLNCYGTKRNAYGEDVSNNGGEDDSMRVELGYDFAQMSFGIAWKKLDKDGKWQVWMVGGLIFHESSQDWSCHT